MECRSRNRQPRGSGHLGENEQEEGSSFVGINDSDGKPGESSITCQFGRNMEISRTRIKLTGPKPKEVNSTGLDEDYRRVKSNGVDYSKGG